MGKDEARAFRRIWAAILGSPRSLSAPLSVLSDSACSISEAASLEQELLDEYRFGRQQLVELCGQGSAVAVAKVLAPFARGYFNPSLGRGR